MLGVLYALTLRTVIMYNMGNCSSNLTRGSGSADAPGPDHLGKGHMHAAAFHAARDIGVDQVPDPQPLAAPHIEAGS
jgi:hypothetical protein